MEKYLIRGGKELFGEIQVKGAKNAATKILAACLLSEERIQVDNLPKIEDVNRSIDLLKSIGAEVSWQKDSLLISPKITAETDLDSRLVKKFRSSIMFVGPLLARCGSVSFAEPGGCAIASGAKRPIDFFLKGWEKMGAKADLKDGKCRLFAKKLQGAEIFFPNISVTATEAMMMTAVLADGTTILKNCAMEPEISALAEYLNSVGADIQGFGSPTIKIKGVKKIAAQSYEIIPDRIETATFAMMAAATNSELKIANTDPRLLEILWNLFDRIGVPYTLGKNYAIIHKSNRLTACDAATHEYPGFATDFLSPYIVLMTQAQGQSLIHETIFDRRLFFSDNLLQMGASIVLCDPHRILVSGPSKLIGRKVLSPDLRAGIAMIIAGLIAEGTTEISNIYQINRGYEDIAGRLRSIGADIQKIEE